MVAPCIAEEFWPATGRATTDRKRTFRRVSFVRLRNSSGAIDATFVRLCLHRLRRSVGPACPATRRSFTQREKSSKPVAKIVASRVDNPPLLSLSTGRRGIFPLSQSRGNSPAQRQSVSNPQPHEPPPPMKIRSLVTTFGVIFAALTMAAHATTYYVDPVTGSMSNPG